MINNNSLKITKNTIKVIFDIKDYMAKNTINVGKIQKEVGSTPYKGGHNDIRKTN